MQEIEQGVVYVEDVQATAEDCRALGWEIEIPPEEDSRRAVVLRRNFGHWRGHTLVAALTVWFTLGVGNLAWAVLSYFFFPARRVLREQSQHQAVQGEAVEES